MLPFISTYFHVVFTLPEAINKLCLFEPAKVYKLLFDTAWSVIRDFGQDEKHLGAQMGMICILHTWGQNLSLHPPLHCIVPAGGLTKAGYWRQARSNGEFLFPVKALSPVFRARFVAVLRKQFTKLERPFYDALFKTPWVVYTRQAFGGPQQVVEYLGRYTHKIAISNHRIISFTDGKVCFRYKDYRDESKTKTMPLDATEFIRRFALHILPKGFVRIRHYGILSSSRKQKTLPAIYYHLWQCVSKGGEKRLETDLHSAPWLQPGLLSGVQKANHGHYPCLRQARAAGACDHSVAYPVTTITTGIGLPFRETLPLP